MAISPQVISWSYQKGSGIVPNTIVKLTPAYFITSKQIKTADKPNWLNVFLDSFEMIDDRPNNIDYFNIKVSVVPSYANNLSIGNHQARFRIGYILPVLGATVYEYLTVNISVTEVQKLYVNRNIIYRGWNRSDDSLTPDYVQIKTPRNWSIILNQPWLTVTPMSGSGDRTIAINYDLAEAPNGFNYADILIDDGNSTHNIDVTILVSGEIAPDDSQEVSPALLEFSGEKGDISNAEKFISITNTQEITVTSNVNWLSISEATIEAGTSQLGVSIQNANEFLTGIYTAKVILTSSYAVSEVNVILRIVEKSANGIASNNFYYAKDRNELFLTNSEQNTEAVLDFEVESTRGLSLFSKRVPFFQNNASSIIGLEAENLLYPADLPDVLATQIYAGIKPMLLKVSVSDKNLLTFAVTPRTVYSGLKFLNGKTPVIEDRLNYIPDSITAPADGIIAMSFRETENTPLSDLNITGSVTGILPIEAIDTGIYSILINLSDYGIKPGDVIDITAPAFEVKVRIADAIVSAVPLIWLNEWQLPEVFNLTGELEMIYDDDSRHTVKSVAGRELTSIIDVKEAKSFAVNTGNVYSEEEARWLGTILRSKKMWLQLGAERVEVIPTFRRLSVSKSRRYNLSYDLTFEAAAR